MPDIDELDPDDEGPEGPFSILPQDGAADPSPSAPSDGSPFSTNDPSANLGSIIHHLVTGAEPEDFHPGLQPLARSLSPLFAARPETASGMPDGDRVWALAPVLQNLGE